MPSSSNNVRIELPRQLYEEIADYGQRQQRPTTKTAAEALKAGLILLAMVESHEKAEKARSKRSALYSQIQALAIEQGLTPTELTNQILAQARRGELNAVSKLW